MSRESGRGARLVELLARLYPWDVDASEDLAHALGFLGSSVSAEAVVRAGYGAALACVPAVVVAVSLVSGWLRLAAGLVGVGLLVALVHAVHTAPHVLATARRTRALGEAPALVSRAVLRMRITPSVESAAAFAADTGTGPLALSLRDHVHRAVGTPGSGLPQFAAEWSEWFGSLRRALLLVESAGSAAAGERERTLDRGMRAVLDGARDEMATFAASLKGPASALYAFGVFLPLALVALLPTVRMTGVATPLLGIVLLYDVLLPAALLAASGWLLVRRPVTFPPPQISRSHPDLPDHDWLPVLAGVLAGVAAAGVSVVVVGSWTGPLAAVGCGLGAALVAHYRPVKAVRDHVSAVEDGLTDALYHVGRRVENGEAVERAIESTATEVAGPTGDVFAAAARRQKQCKASVREAFLGRHGALDTVPSVRARSTATLLALAAREGRPAGSAIVTMADHLEDLSQVEQEARNRIGQVTSTLANTAAVFGPMVAGATVALADGMQTTGQFGAGGGPGTPGLGLAVGVYALVLAGLLTALSTGLARGLDRALVGYRVGWALLTATATYLATVHAAGLLL